MPLEYVVPSLHITIPIWLSYDQSLQRKLDDIMDLEEDMVLVGHNQQVEKRQQKAWHDRNITNKILELGSLALLYDSKFLKIQGIRAWGG